MSPNKETIKSSMLVSHNRSLRQGSIGPYIHMDTVKIDPPCCSFVLTILSVLRQNSLMQEISSIISVFTQLCGKTRVPSCFQLLPQWRPDWLWGIKSIEQHWKSLIWWPFTLSLLVCDSLSLSSHFLLSYLSPVSLPRVPPRRTLVISPRTVCNRLFNRRQTSSCDQFTSLTHHVPLFKPPYRRTEAMATRPPVRLLRKASSDTPGRAGPEALGMRYPGESEYAVGRRSIQAGRCLSR